MGCKPKTKFLSVFHSSSMLMLWLVILAAVGCHGRGVRKSAPTCPAARTACPGISGQEICTDVQTDVSHCGACGVSCSQGEVCVQGQCAGYCPAPFQSCPDASGKPACRDLGVDAENCGACGVACPAGQVCLQGACSLQCAPPQTVCTSSGKTVCTNLQNDNLHCGACDFICPGQLVCLDGRCGPCSRTTIPGGVMLLDFGAKPASPVIADLDNDGVPDLVATSASENTVTLRLGNGDGSFTDAQTITTGQGPKAVVVGDFDGDGQPDLAVANAGSKDLVIIKGEPEAHGWREWQRLSLPAVPLAMAAGDLDQDGRADLVLILQGSSAGELVARLSSKGESFWESPRIALQGTPTALVLADFDGDQRLDAAVSLQEGNVAIALTDEDGRPRPVHRFATGPGSVALLAVDLNNDSRLDLVASSTGDNSLRVLLGQGDGSFAAAVRYDLGSAPTGLFAADIDGDGKPDVLTGAMAEHSVRVLPGLGDGRLGPSKLIPAGSSPVEIRAADLNRDGKPDLVAAHAYDKGRVLSVLLARDTGVYTPRTQALTDAPFAMRLADLDGDGKQDAVLLGSKLSVARGLGGGSFAPATAYAVGNEGAVDLAIADLNQDGKPDVTVATSKVLMIFLNDGSGTLASPKTVAAKTPLYSFAVGDIDRDGRPDFATAHDHGIDLYMGTASGDYQSKSLLYGPCGCDYRPSMRFLDLDRDGHLDLVTVNHDSYGIFDNWLGDGKGGFTRLTSSGAIAKGDTPRLLGILQPQEGGPPGLMVVDRGSTSSMNGLQTGSLASYRGLGDGSLSLLSYRPLGAYVGDGAMADLDQDGAVDALAPLTVAISPVGIDGRQRVSPEYVDRTDNSIAILRGLRDGALEPWMAYWLETPASAVAAADLNGDGNVDIVAAHDTKPGLTVLLTKVTPCR